MNKKIITIAEIVFALVFVVLLSVFMATINTKGNQANNQLVDTLEMTSGTSIDKYVQMSGSTTETVKGTDVANVASNYKTLGGNAKIQIRVVTNASGSDGKDYGYLTQSASVTVGGKTVEKGGDLGGYVTPSSTDPHYINPSADFKVNVTGNNNGVYDLITFTQKSFTQEQE